MKWLWEVETVQSDATQPGQRLAGAHYGGFGEAVAQVARAIEAEGWGKNTVAISINFTPDRLNP